MPAVLLVQTRGVAQHPEAMAAVATAVALVGDEVAVVKAQQRQRNSF